MSKDASDLLTFAAGEIAARTWEKGSSCTSLDAASAVMKRRLTQNWGVTSAREVARIKLEGRWGVATRCIVIAGYLRG